MIASLMDFGKNEQITNIALFTADNEGCRLLRNDELL